MQLKNTVLQNNNNDEIFNDGDVKSIPQPTEKYQLNFINILYSNNNEQQMEEMG